MQIAKAFGAEVTGVCSTAKTDLVRSLGADHVIDYTTDDFAAGAVRYDVIIDTGGNRRLSDLRRALTPTGNARDRRRGDGRPVARRLRALARARCCVSTVVRQKLTMLASKENADDLAALRELIEAGGVTPAVDRSYPLRETPDAIARVHAGEALGKVVIVN